MENRITGMPVVDAQSRVVSALLTLPVGLKPAGSDHQNDTSYYEVILIGR